jgi:hypothetical protein
MDLDTVPSQQTWDEELKRGECHIVTFASIGLSFFKSYCEDFMLEEEIYDYADRINKSNETGTLFPQVNITALPVHFFEGSLSRKETAYETLLQLGLIKDFEKCIRDAFVAERDYIKSGLMILEFTCSEIPYKMVESICRELCEKEFSSLPGHAVLRHNNNA